MSNDSGVSIDFGFLAIALLIICFYGEPDLIDALIKYFMSATC